MKFVIINLGRNAYGVRAGDKVVTLALFKLDEAANPEYQEYAIGRKPGPSLEETCRLLSYDLVEVERRARSEAKKTVQDSAVWLGVILSLMVIVPTIVLALAPPFLQSSFSYGSADERMDQIENDFNSRIEILTNKLIKLSSAEGHGQAK